MKLVGRDKELESVRACLKANRNVLLEGPVGVGKTHLALAVTQETGKPVYRVDGDSRYVRVQVLTNAGALDRDKQLAVVERLTAIVAEAAGDPSLAERTWVLLTEAPEGGWGLAGHAYTNAELVQKARSELAAGRAPAGG